MSHIYHPDLGDPARPAILVDECPSCEESARYPVERLDSYFMRALWSKMVEVEHTNPSGGSYSSTAEASACRKLFAIALFLERHTVIDPWTFGIPTVSS